MLGFSAKISSEGRTLGPAMVLSTDADIATDVRCGIRALARKKRIGSRPSSGDGRQQSLHLGDEALLVTEDEQRLPLATAPQVLEGTANTVITLLVHQLFPVTRHPEKQVTYQYDSFTVSLIGLEYGVATAYDKAVLYYILALLHEQTVPPQQANKEIAYDVSSVPNTFTFDASDYFKVAGISSPGGSQHHQLYMALRRLRSTSVRTDIGAGNGRDHVMTDFNWLNKLRVQTNGKSDDIRLKSITVEIPSVLVQHLQRNRDRVVALSTETWKFGPVERRLYELALGTMSVTGQAAFWMALEDLRIRSGAKSRIAAFKYELAKLLRKRANGADADTDGPCSREIGPFHVELILDSRLVPPGTAKANLRSDATQRYAVVFSHQSVDRDQLDLASLPYVDFSKVMEGKMS